MQRVILISLTLVFANLVCAAQNEGNVITIKREQPAAQTTKSSPAYAEVLLKKTEWEAEIEALLINYTEEFPRVVEARYEIAALKREMDRLLAAKVSDASKLTLALGKLMVKKAELQTDLWKLLKKYDAEHVEVKQTKRKMEIYEAAIKDILG